jgi:phospho-N-acetylmuramoyl-pentapeptide-transferase
VTVLIASIISLVCVGIFILLAKQFGWGKSIRKAGPESHLAKEGTPTMGGIAFLLAAIGVWLFLPKSADGYALVLLTLAAALIGWYDDILSLQRKKKVALGEDASTGLLARYRLLGQGLVAFTFAIYASRTGHTLFNLTFLDILLYTHHHGSDKRHQFFRWFRWFSKRHDGHYAIAVCVVAVCLTHNGSTPWFSLVQQ